MVLFEKKQKILIRNDIFCTVTTLISHLDSETCINKKKLMSVKSSRGTILVGNLDGQFCAKSDFDFLLETTENSVRCLRISDFWFRLGFDLIRGLELCIQEGQQHPHHITPNLIEFIFWY